MLGLCSAPTRGKGGLFSEGLQDGLLEMRETVFSSPNIQSSVFSSSDGSHPFPPLPYSTHGLLAGS